MAREAKIIISATDKSPEGIDDAIKNFERMGYKAKAVTKETNNSIIEMAKESKRQLEGINAALQLGGWLLMAKGVANALGDITKEARENSNAFKDATSAFSDVRKEIGTGIVQAMEPMVSWIGKIAERWADASKAVREYHQAQDKLSSGKTMTTADKMALASGQLADTRQKISDTTSAAGIAAGRGQKVDVSGALQQLKAQEASLVETIRGLALETLGAGKIEEIATAAAAAVAVSTPAALVGGTYGIGMGSSWKPANDGIGMGDGGAGLGDRGQGYDFGGSAPAINSGRTDGVSMGQGSDGAKAGPLAGLMDILGQVGGGFMGMLKSVGGVMKIMDPLGTILGSMFEVIGPLINEALAPLIKILTTVGTMLGHFLTPIIKVLGEMISQVAKFIVGMLNAVISAINWAMPGSKWDIEKIKLGSGDTAPPAETTGGGGSYAGSQSITFNFFNQGNVVGSGGLEELAMLIAGLIKQNSRYAT